MPLILALALGLWGIGWNLPDHERIRRMLPEGLDGPGLHQALASSWRELYRRLGQDILLSPEVYSYGFEREASVSPGWKAAPPLLQSPIRSFHLRSGHEDESDILVALSRIKPHRLEFNPRIYFYGGAYMYALGAWTAVGSLVTPAALRGSVEYYLDDTDKAAWLFLLGRLFSVAAYLAGVGLLWLLGERLFGRHAGTFAALLFAAAPGVVLQAHYMKPHLLGSVFVLAAYALCLQGRWRWAGTCVGLAAGCALYQWIAAFIPFAAFLLRGRGRRTDPGREALGLAQAAACALLAFALTNVFLFLEPVTSWEGLRRVGGHAAVRLVQIPELAFIGLPKALTVPAALWVAAGLLRPSNLKKPEALLAALSFAWLLSCAWVFQSAGDLDSVRYFPGLAFGCLLAGRLFSEELSKGRRRRWAVLGAAGLAVGWAANASAVLDRNFQLSSTARSTHRRAGDWIEANLPPGTELGLVKLPQPSNSPYFRWDRYRLRFFEPRGFDALEDPRRAPRHLVLAHPTYDLRPRLRTALEKNYELEASFGPAFWLWKPPVGETYANPLIEIYRLNPSATRASG